MGASSVGANPVFWATISETSVPNESNVESVVGSMKPF